MDREWFTKVKNQIFFYCVAYGLICEAVSLFVLGFDAGFAIGITVGILAVTINLRILEKVVDIAITGQRVWRAILFQLGRLLFFGIAGFLCYKIGLTAVIAYGFGVIGLTAAAAVVYIKEEKNG